MRRRFGLPRFSFLFHTNKISDRRDRLKRGDFSFPPREVKTLSFRAWGSSLPQTFDRAFPGSCIAPGSIIGRALSVIGAVNQSDSFLYEFGKVAAIISCVSSRGASPLGTGDDNESSRDSSSDRVDILQSAKDRQPRLSGENHGSSGGNRRSHGSENGFSGFQPTGGLGGGSNRRVTPDNS